MPRSVLAFLCVFQTAVYAQFNSSIQGVVTGAAVPGVVVTVTNAGTGVVREVETLDDGLFRVLNLGPGTYRVAVQKPGFAVEIEA